MNCRNCSAKMKETTENYRYKESGLDNVMLADIKIRRCPDCGDVCVSIPGMEELHQEIACAVARKAGHLNPAEVRFIRKYLGFSGADFAKRMGVTPETVSRWESGAKPLGPISERMVRLAALAMTPVRNYDLSELDLIDAKGGPSGLRVVHKGNHWSAKATVAA